MALVHDDASATSNGSSPITPGNKNKRGRRSRARCSSASHLQQAVPRTWCNRRVSTRDRRAATPVPIVVRSHRVHLASRDTFPTAKSWRWRPWCWLRCSSPSGSLRWPCFWCFARRRTAFLTNPSLTTSLSKRTKATLLIPRSGTSRCARPAQCTGPSPVSFVQFPLRDEFLRVKEATKGKEPAKYLSASFAALHC